MDPDRDLDFAAMVKAHELVEKEEVKSGMLHGRGFV